jgi:hypothetical protein
MSSRTAEFASAILIGATVGVFAGAYLITMPYAASDDCVTQPTGNTPQGQHWYYRIEHGSKRHCWYLRGEADKSARAVSSDKPSKVAARKQDGASQHSIADAHAELWSRARIEDNTSAAGVQSGPSSVVANAAVNAPVVDDNGTGANVMSRWPDPVAVNAPAAAQPDTAEMTVVADAQVPTAATADQAPAAADPAPASPPPAPMTAVPDQQDTAPPAAVNGPGKYSGSLQELLLVAFAALALAGLTGSGVYRLARTSRAKRYDASRRSNDWQQPRRRKKSSKARRVEPQPVVMEALKVAPKAKYAPEPQHAAEPEYVPESRYAAEPDHAGSDRDQQHQSDSDYAPEHGYESERGYVPEHNYEPQSEYAPRPQFAAQPSYASSTHTEYEPVSEYAPKPVSQYAPKPRGRVHSRELDESYESIEQLLIRLAK